MKTVYDLYHLTAADAAPEISYGHATLEAAEEHAGLDDPNWRYFPETGHWLLEDSTGEYVDWVVLERFTADTVGERLKLALEFIANPTQPAIQARSFPLLLTND